MAVTGGEQIGGDISGDAEQPGMAERNQAGIADQHVEPEREDGVEQDLARDIDVIDFAASRNGTAISARTATTMATRRTVTGTLAESFTGSVLRTGPAAATPAPAPSAGTE